MNLQSSFGRHLDNGGDLSWGLRIGDCRGLHMDGLVIGFDIFQLVEGFSWEGDQLHITTDRCEEVPFQLAQRVSHFCEYFGEAKQAEYVHDVPEMMIWTKSTPR